MEIVVYAYDVTVLKHIEEALEKKTYRVAYETEDIADSLVVCALDNDVRANDALIKELVERGNRILLLQSLPQIEPARHYLSLGVYGYGNTRMDTLFLLSAIEALQSNMMWIHPEITAKMVELLTPIYETHSFFGKLSPREREIALMLLEGKLYNEIASALSITPRTVKAHTTHIYQKLQVKDRLDFALQYK
ncbi:MAG: response regulator transcription factor [Sulfuricurvum sp.]|uniref:response regulator transcription factor n=1 Tax=Sulfuricurvum sp. TaxID=2025608 RepID=UPI00260921AB|nr:response regulator transcription factor [uncultured Sulfuricurvum sp.]